ncbi:MAG: DUF1572 domain-containing protein [Bacteroidia bacterium]
MNTFQHLAKQFKEVYFGGNWTCVNLKDSISDLSIEEANQKVADFNTIFCLCYHIHYYVKVQMAYLNGIPVHASDEMSFKHPEINDEQSWKSFKEEVFKEAADYIACLAAIEESKVNLSFIAEQYGTYFRNINGLIEHTHYHLGQIVLLKKWIRSTGRI